MKKCNNCGQQLEDTAKFCPECGTKLEIKRFCMECGAELNPTAKFCMECGTPVKSNEVSKDSNKTSNKDTEKKNKEVPVEKLNFSIYEVSCEVPRAASFLEDELGTGNGFFIAGKCPDDLGINKPLEQNTFLGSFSEGPIEAFRNYLVTDNENSWDLLYTSLINDNEIEGRFMVAWMDDDNEEKLREKTAALALIFAEYSGNIVDDDLEYEGPEAIYELNFLDGDDSDEEVESHRFHIFKDEDGDWEVEEL